MTYGTGEEAGVTIKYDALQIGVYGAQRENLTTVAAGLDNTRDEFNGVWYAKYSMGPVSIGYSEFYVDAGVTESAPVATDSVKTLRTAGGFTEGNQMGIAFNINDNLSVSYTCLLYTSDAADE